MSRLHIVCRPNEFEYSQFVHRSGVAFVQVLGGLDGFLWLNNRLFNSHFHGGGNSQQQQRQKQEAVVDADKLSWS